MTERVWLNGTLQDAATARIDPADRGLLLGDGLFETMHAVDGIVARLDRHLARLAEGAALLRITLPACLAGVAAACQALAPAGGSALRLTLTRGPAPRGLAPHAHPTPTLLLTAGPLPHPGPARVIVASRTRRNEHSPLSRVKSLNYLDGVLARAEAAEAGADDALLLNTAGDVAEASAASLLLRVNGEWITPAVSDGALPGLGRAEWLERGEAREARVTREMLGRAEAGKLVNALGVREVVRFLL